MRELTGRTRLLVRSASLLLVAALYAGALSAVLGWRPGVWLVLGACGVLFAVHLVIGVVAYRQTMGREWPRVAPLEDEDDDW